MSRSANYIDVIGYIWMPSTMAAMRYELSSYDVNNIEEYADIASKEAHEPFRVDREDVEQWLMLHSGDFQSIADFSATIDNVEYEWVDVESAFTFHDLMYGDSE